MYVAPRNAPAVGSPRLAAVRVPRRCSAILRSTQSPVGLASQATISPTITTCCPLRISSAWAQRPGPGPTDHCGRPPTRRNSPPCTSRGCPWWSLRTPCWQCHGVSACPHRPRDSDPSCAFMLIQKAVLDSVTNDLGALHEGLQWEFIARLHKQGFRIREIPIHHRPRKTGLTKVFRLGKIPRIACSNVLGLLSVWWQLRTRPTKHAEESPVLPQRLGSASANFEG